MMGWFQRVFHLQSSITHNVEELARAGLLQLLGNTVPASGIRTAAVEACCALWGGCLSGATLRPERLSKLLTASFLDGAVRACLRYGNSLHYITMSDDELVLLPVTSYEVHNYSVRESDWTYRVDLSTPNGSMQVLTRPEQVLHLKWTSEASMPWNGTAALPDLTDSLVGNLERSLGHEHNRSTGAVITVPENTKLAQAKERAEKIKDLKGRTAVLQSTRTQIDLQSVQPGNDQRPIRYGPEPTAESVALREQLEMSIANSCGVPSGLLNPKTEGMASRELLKRFYNSSLIPLARRWSEEIQKKLALPDEQVMFEFDHMHYQDVQARGRTYKVLIDAGLDKTEALQKVGW